MKQSLILTAGILLFFLTAPAQPKGYQINVHIKPLKKQWIYLGSYYGKRMPVMDSIFLNEQGQGVFKGKNTLPQGIYLLAISKNELLMELLVGKNQYFSITTDTAHIETATTFTGSPENTQFQAYTAYVSQRGKILEDARSLFRQTTNMGIKAKMQIIIDKNAGEIENYRKKVIKTQPHGLLSTIFNAMQEIHLPEKLKRPATLQDTLETYYYTRQHYWDGVNFMDGKLVHTPILEKKLAQYLNTYVSPQADSIIYEFNWMIALGRNDPEMFQFLIGYYVDNYFNPQIMGQDKVFLHVYERYFATGQVTWLTQAQLKQIEDRAMMIIANQLGGQAADLQLIDTAGAVQSLYNQKGNYTVVVFWDPDCGHCKTEIPKLDSLYRIFWKKENVRMYAIMTAEASIANWKPFIRQYAVGWTHVHQTATMKAEEEKNKQPNYRQLYDIRTTPTIFLLDKDKKIIAKNISIDNLDKILQQKLKQNN